MIKYNKKILYEKTPIFQLEKKYGPIITFNYNDIENLKKINENNKNNKNKIIKGGETSRLTHFKHLMIALTISVIIFGINYISNIIYSWRLNGIIYPILAIVIFVKIYLIGKITVTKMGLKYSGNIEKNKIGDKISKLTFKIVTIADTIIDKIPSIPTIPVPNLNKAPFSSIRNNIQKLKINVKIDENKYKLQLIIPSLEFEFVNPLALMCCTFEGVKKFLEAINKNVIKPMAKAAEIIYIPIKNSLIAFKNAVLDPLAKGCIEMWKGIMKFFTILAGAAIDFMKAFEWIPGIGWIISQVRKKAEETLIKIKLRKIKLKSLERKQKKKHKIDRRAANDAMNKVNKNVESLLKAEMEDVNLNYKKKKVEDLSKEHPNIIKEYKDFFNHINHEAHLKKELGHKIEFMYRKVIIPRADDKDKKHKLHEMNHKIVTLHKEANAERNLRLTQFRAHKFKYNKSDIEHLKEYHNEKEEIIKSINEERHKELRSKGFAGGGFFDRVKKLQINQKYNNYIHHEIQLLKYDMFLGGNKKYKGGKNTINKINKENKVPKKPKIHKINKETKINKINKETKINKENKTKKYKEKNKSYIYINKLDKKINNTSAKCLNKLHNLKSIENVYESKYELKGFLKTYFYYKNKYINKYDKRQDNVYYITTQHLRNKLKYLKNKCKLTPQEIAEKVNECINKEGNKNINVINKCTNIINDFVNKCKFAKKMEIKKKKYKKYLKKNGLKMKGGIFNNLNPMYWLEKAAKEALKTVERLIDPLKKAFNAVKKIVCSIDYILNTILDNVDKVGIIPKTISIIAKGIEYIIRFVTDTLPGFFAKITTILQNIGGLVTWYVTTCLKRLIVVIKTTIEFVILLQNRTAGAMQIPKWATSANPLLALPIVLEGLIKFLDLPFKKYFDIIPNLLKKLFGGIPTQWLVDLLNGFRDAANYTLGQLKRGYDHAKNALMGAIKAADKVKKWFKVDVIDKIPGLKQIYNLIKRLANGMDCNQPDL